MQFSRPRGVPLVGMCMLTFRPAKTTHGQREERRVDAAHKQHVLAFLIVINPIPTCTFQNVPHLGRAVGVVGRKQSVVGLFAHFAHHRVQNRRVVGRRLAAEVGPLALVFAKQRPTLSVDLRPDEQTCRLDRLTLVLERRPYHVAYISHLKYAL